MKLVSSLLFFLLSLTATSQTLAINFDNIRNQKGVICLNLYETAESWLDEDVDDLEFIFSKEELNDKKLTVTVDLTKPGYYGIAVLDDEDEDGEMQNNFMGFPREGFGFSRNVKVRLFKPKFEECVFEIRNDTTINISMQYK